MSDLGNNRDLVQFLVEFDGGLERFLQVSKCMYDLCSHTHSQLEILTCLNAGGNITAKALHDPGDFTKNFNVYQHIEKIDDAEGFIQALYKTNNKKALDHIRQAIERIKLKQHPIQPETSGISEEQGLKVPPESGIRESTVQPSEIREIQQRQSPGTSAQSVHTTSTGISESTNIGDIFHTQTPSNVSSDPVVSIVSNSSQNEITASPDSDCTSAKEYLLALVDAGAPVEDLISSKLTDICRSSKNIVLFLTNLHSNNVISIPEQEELNKCSENYGSTTAFNLIYDSLIGCNKGVALIKAWEASENYHIIKLCYEQQQSQGAERRVSRDQVQEEAHDQQLKYILQLQQKQQQELQQPQQQNHGTFLEPSRQHPRSATRTGRPESMVSLEPFDTTDSPYTQTSSCLSEDPDLSNYSRHSSNANRYFESGTPKTPLTLIKGQLIEKGTKTVHLNWMETKVKHIAQACKNSQKTLDTIKIENIILTRPKRLKIIQQLGRVRCNCPNLKEFFISEAASLKIIRLTTLKSLMFFTSANFNFDKSPTLCSVMNESELNTISYKKGGVTFVHLKKAEDDGSRDPKLVLRFLSFLKCEAFLKDAVSFFTAFSFSAYGFKSLDLSLNVLQIAEHVTELVLIKVSFTPGSETLYTFKNLTKLIVHLNQHKKNPNNYFELNLSKLLNCAKQLETLVLRDVTLVGNLSETSKQRIARFKSVLLYTCSLENVNGILTVLQKKDNVGWENKLILKWENKTGDKNLLFWDIVNFVDSNLYFYRFEMSDFYEKKVWNNEYAKEFVKSNNIYAHPTFDNTNVQTNIYL